MKHMSIKRKVTLWYACMLFLIVLLLFGFIFLVSGHIFRSESLDTLKVAVQKFADDIEWEDDDDAYELDDDIQFYEYGVLFSLYNTEGHLVAGNIPQTFPEDTVLKASTFQEFSAGKESWDTYDLALSYGQGQILWIRGVLPSDTFFSMEQTLFLLLLIACPLLIAIALLVGYSITRRAFLPIEEIQQIAEEIGDGNDLSRRIPTNRAQGEIQQLADTFNHMFERLEQAFDRERQFTADASHELRTPLSVITAEAEYALLPDSTPLEQQEGLQVILKQAHKMSSLISQLLMLARADRGTQKLQLAPLDFSALVTITAENFAVQASRKQIQLHTQIQPDLRVLGDQSSLVRALLNLLENAVQYGRENGHIDLRLFAEKGTLYCSIQDDGIGIAPEHLEKIWQRFYRVDASRNTRPEHAGSNSGLGLSLVKWIIEAHQGTISVKSTPGEGTTFTFCLKQFL